jgi:hypothetical protein
MLHGNPAKLYLGDEEICEVYDWTYLGVVGYPGSGRTAAVAQIRKVWSMLCDREPHTDQAEVHSLKRGSEHMKVVIESTRPSRIDGRTYSMVKCTTEDGCKFGHTG